MIYEIYHETKFDYAGLVTFSHNIARLKPKNSDTQKLLEYSLNIEPTPYETNEFIDYFENTNNFMLRREAHTTLKVIAKSKVERIEKNINEELEKLKNVSITFGEAKERLNKYYKDDVLAKLFLFETESIPAASNEIINYALESFWDGRNLYEATNEFTIYSHIGLDQFVSISRFDSRFFRRVKNEFSLKSQYFSRFLQYKSLARSTSGRDSLDHLLSQKP